MTRFIFESDIPSWANAGVLADRLDRWALAGFDTVMLQVDDGHGATWPTQAWNADQRVSHDVLTKAVAAIHDRGMSVIACVSLATFNESFSHYPGFRLSRYQFPFYDFWNEQFRAQRGQMLVDLSIACDLDGIALDYLRTGREAMGDEAQAESVLTAWLSEVRATISPGVPILSVHHSSYASGVKEGVNLVAWSDAELIDGAVLFNYSPVFPASHAAALMAATTMEVWPLIGNYDWINSAAVTRSGHAVSRTLRQVVRTLSPDGIGLYLANLLTDEQAVAIRDTQRMVTGL